MSWHAFACNADACNLQGLTAEDHARAADHTQIVSLLRVDT